MIPKMRKGIPVLPSRKCTCGLGTMNFFLPIKKLHSAKNGDGSSIPPKEMAITEGSRLQTSQGYVDDYVKIIGVCAECKVEHSAILVVKNGLVHGIQPNSIIPVFPTKNEN